MKCASNNLPCPMPQWCHPGCYFNDGNTLYRPTHAPLHSRKGGNIVTDGAALKPLYDGDDVIAQPLASRVRLGLMVCGLLWLVALGVLIVRVV